MNHNSTRRNIHMGAGLATAALYATAASFSILAPKPEGIQDTGSIKIHRALAWVHGPLMLATPVLGALAYRQENNHQRVHGIASLHGAAATALVITYLASLAEMKLRELSILAAASLMPFSGFAATETWLLDHATLTYTVHHPLKTASGTSQAAKGKGQCKNDSCEFLVAAPLKSFDSGDSNRDLHMLAVTRGGNNPMVVVHSTYSEKAPKDKVGPMSVDVDFAGKRKPITMSFSTS